VHTHWTHVTSRFLSFACPLPADIRLPNVLHSQPGCSLMPVQDKNKDKKKREKKEKKEKKEKRDKRDAERGDDGGDSHKRRRVEAVSS
jgi:hypothetical protein